MRYNFLVILKPCGSLILILELMIKLINQIALGVDQENMESGQMEREVVSNLIGSVIYNCGMYIEHLNIE